MQTFFEIIKVQFKTSIQYKWGFAITLIIQPIIMLINIALFRSIYEYNKVSFIKGYDVDQMIWYFTTVCFMFGLIWNYADTHLSDKILTGDLAIDLLRPIQLFRVEVARAIGLKIVTIFFEFLPGLLIFSLIYYPRFLTLSSLLKFILLAFMAFSLYFLFNFLMGLCAFIIKNNTSLIAIRTTFVTVMGGAVIPIEFYPKSFAQILDWLPFKYIFYWPIQFFLNQDNTRSGEALLKTFSMQLLWVIILYSCCWFFEKKVFKKFCSAGG